MTNIPKEIKKSNNFNKLIKIDYNIFVTLYFIEYHKRETISALVIQFYQWVGYKKRISETLLRHLRLAWWRDNLLVGQHPVDHLPAEVSVLLGHDFTELFDALEVLYDASCEQEQQAYQKSWEALYCLIARYLGEVSEEESVVIRLYASSYAGLLAKTQYVHEIKKKPKLTRGFRCLALPEIIACYHHTKIKMIWKMLCAFL